MKLNLRTLASDVGIAVVDKEPIVIIEPFSITKSFIIESLLISSFFIMMENHQRARLPLVENLMRGFKILVR